jgi:hypothetical protein
MTNIDTRLVIGTFISANGCKGHICEIENYNIFIVSNGLIIKYDTRYVEIFIVKNSKVKFMNDDSWTQGTVYFASQTVSVIHTEDDEYKIISSELVYSNITPPIDIPMNITNHIQFITIWEGDKYLVKIIKRLGDGLVLVMYEEDEYFEVIPSCEIFEYIEDDSMPSLINCNSDDESMPSLINCDSDDKSIPSLESIRDDSESYPELD